MKSFSDDDMRRYSRNIMLDEMGIEGQRRLSAASVLAVGCGALGTVAAMYLVASGIGKIGLVDFDTVDISNLQRQLSFTENDIGKKKVAVLAEKLRSINSGTIVEPFDRFLTKNLAKELIDRYDVILEGSDNPDTKYMVSDLCCELKKPMVLGGIKGFQGQVLTCVPGTFTYRDIFPEPAPFEECTPCALGGVLGPLPGIIGSIQATEVIKIAADIGKTLANRLLMINALTLEFTEIRLS